ncbi:MAG: hypothetical protein M3Y56_13070, partial [Armatimonadota bacterium]|nr:hypothetical protein [Armatimonadota bacterium]
MKYAKLLRAAVLVLLSAAALPDAAAARPSDALPGIITVHVTPKPANTFVAAQALGAGVDGLEHNG